MSDVDDELLTVKRALKQWEADFFHQHKRRPGKEDVDGAPANILRAYRRYSELKKIRAQPVDVWGKELNKSTSDVTSTKQTNQHDSSQTYMSNIGKKLLARASFDSSPAAKYTSSRGFEEEDNDDISETHTSSSNKSSIFDTALKLTVSNKQTAGSSGQGRMSFSGCDSDEVPRIQSSSNKSSIFDNALKLTASNKQTAGSSGQGRMSFSGCDSDEVPRIQSSSNKSSIFDNALKLTASNKQTAGSSGQGRMSEAKLPSQSFARTASFLQNLSSSQGPTTASDDSRSFVHQSKARQDISDSDNELDSDYASFRGKKLSKERVANLSESKRALAVSPSGSEAEDNPKVKTKSKSKAKQPAKPRKKKPRAGSDNEAVSNDNFVKLNMKLKKYRPKGSANGKSFGGGRMTFRQRMMEKRKKDRSADKCFKCGGEGHWAQECKGFKSAGPDDDDEPDNLRRGICFRCGEEGHWARQCRGLHMKNPQPPPDWAPGPSPMDTGKNAGAGVDASIAVADDDFPSMEEAVMLSRGIKTNLTSSQTSGDSSGTRDSIVVEVVRSPYERPAPVRCIEPLYRLNADGSLPETPEEVIDGLREFGFNRFRPGQEAAVMRVLCGLSTLVVLSTGAGKSLIYQLAAYMYARRRKCITLVVSPLVSLMQDQVSELPDCVRGACIHTNMTLAQRKSVTDRAIAGELDFLLMSPEMIVGGNSNVGSASHGLLGRLPPLAFTCVDEAHCVSEWSHHFRPSYLRVCTVLRDQYGVKCMLGLTATATLTTAYSVARHLGIKGGAGATIRGAPIPENLNLSVSRDGNRDQALLRLLHGGLFSKCKSIIVYCTRREQTNKVAGIIRYGMKKFDDGGSDDEAGSRTPPRGKRGRGGSRASGRRGGKWNVECYHAGLTPLARKTIQEDFMSGRLRVVVATVAFGMGIDKRDIHGVVHYTMPKNIESYVQEIGRAGRDGEQSYCHLFLDCKGEDRNELKRHIYARSVDRIAVKKLVRRVFMPCKCHLQPRAKTTTVETNVAMNDNSSIGAAKSVVTAAANNSAEAVNEVEGFDVTGLDEPWDEADGESRQPGASCEPGDRLMDVSMKSEPGERDLRNVDMNLEVYDGSRDSLDDIIAAAAVAKSETAVSVEAPEESPVKRRVGVCPGHERALPVNDLIHLLDMKEEVLETLLVYLELHPKKWVENQQPVFCQCTMMFYGGRAQMLSVAKKCPPVAAAIAKAKQQLGSLESMTDKLEFNIVELSDMMGWEASLVRKELKQLVWETAPEGTRKTGVLVDFNTLAYHLRSPGDMQDEELDEVVDFLMNRIETQEKTELFHLENFHETLEEVSFKNVGMCCDVSDPVRSETLRTKLHHYLECQPPPELSGSMSALTFTRESQAVAAKDMEEEAEVEPDKKEAIRRDVSTFIQLYGEEHKLSGRAIARIMHGIDSPRFPATTWGRCRRFWRSHLDVEFHAVRQIATRELVRGRR